MESRPDLGSQEQPARGDTTLEIIGRNSTFMSLDFCDSNEGDNMEDLTLRFLGFKEQQQQQKFGNHFRELKEERDNKRGGKSYFGVKSITSSLGCLCHKRFW